MNSGWHWFVIIASIVNLLACWWLIYWTVKSPIGKDATGNTTGHKWDCDLEELNNPMPRWWLMLFHLTIVFALIYLVLYPGLGNFKGMLGWTQLQQYDEQVAQAQAMQASLFSSLEGLDTADLASNEAAMDSASRLFANNCATCHGSDGRGAPGFPNLTDSEWLYGRDINAIETTITNGRSGMMMAWAGILGEDGVAEVVAYVQQLSGQEHDAALASAGQARFNTSCVACHGAEGKGNPLLGAPDLTNDIWLYGGSVESLTQSVASGRNGVMPAHRGQLSEDRIRILAAYVTSLSAE